MIIHVWMHWFWITLFCKGFLLSISRHVLCSSSVVVEAGLPRLAEDYVLYRNKLFNYTSHDNDDVKVRLRRTVEDEDVGEETTTIAATTTTTPANETVSNEATSADGYQGPVSSDVDDTHNGSDGFYPFKKYTKYTKYGKLKSKPKDAAVDDGAAANVTAEVAVNSTQNITVESVTAPVEVVTTNQTVTEVANVNQTVNATREVVEVDVTETTVVNSTEGPVSSEVLHEEVNLTVESKVDETVLHTTVEPFIFNNRVAAATSSESRERLSQPNLDAGSITGITLGIVVISGFIGAISFVLYRRRYLNKPQALNDKCSNLDSSGYIDDTSLRENSEEMYSLDNDSFLNSLEAMTIQNYWTENVKHTKL